MAWPCTLRTGALVTTLALALAPSIATAAKGDDAATGDADEAAPKGKQAKEPAGPKVTVIDKGELRADTSDIGKVLKKLHKKEKLEFVERSSDNKWAKVRKGKVEGWVLAEQVEGLPPPVVQEPTKAELEAKAAAAAAAAAAEAAAKAPPPPPPVTPPPEPVVVKAPPPPPPEPEAPKDNRAPLSGVWIGVGGGVALLASSINATMQSGLVPELFNYQISNLMALGMQANLGYTFAYKGLRIGVDAGYRFAGATSVVVQLPDRDSLPTTVQGGVTSTTVLKTPRQQLPTSGHDADAAVSIGGYIGLPKQLDISLRARAGFQIFGFLPEFNNATALPQEIFYGPHVGAVLEFGSRFVPGFGLRLNGGYIPYAVRQQNTGLRDGTQDTSTGYFFGASAAVRILRGFDVEVAYRMLSTTTSYQAGSNAERLKYDRDPTVRGRYMTEVLADGAMRATGQQTITLGLVFLRQ